MAQEDKRTATPQQTETGSFFSNLTMMQILAALFAGSSIGLLVGIIVLATRDETTTIVEQVPAAPAAPATVPDDSSEPQVVFATASPPDGPNECEGKKPDLQDLQCIINQIQQTGEQSGTNVTEGYQGDRNTTAEPITVPYYQAGLCPVNVHWHLGTEHLSVGEYDETGTGPSDVNERRRLAGETRLGYQCKLYDEADARFTTEYDWKHCEDMEVGQTYEVHWPHSAAGACGTLMQYQTPFYDGVFCRDGVLTNTAGQIGVQAQVFTIINDESYYYPDLMRGMIVDANMGKEITAYTGSTPLALPATTKFAPSSHPSRGRWIASVILCRN